MKKKIIDLEIIDDLEQSGVAEIALVDVPAIEKYWMAFRDEEFVEPSAGESEEEFLNRCIPAMLEEGKDQDQAVAMCYSMYQNMSYDTGALPVYVDEIGDDKKEELEATEMNIYGYRTGYFYMCPGATALFTDILSDNEEAETVGMIRSAAVVADKLFELEANVIASGKANYGDMEEAIALIEDFGDIMEEVGKIKGEVYNVDFMIGHLEKIQEYYVDKQEFAPIQRIPKEERGREGSDKNKEGDTKTSRGGIEVTEEVEKTLKDKIEEHNKKNPQDSQKADLGMLKAVWRRGAGAYSVGTPGRRGMTRSQWAMGRVNAFLRILGGSAPSDKDYKQDNDLLPKGHPKHSEEKMAKLMFASEDQQIVVGPVAIPDMEIARVNPKTKEKYFVRFSKEVVARMAEKFMKELRNRETNIQHNTEDRAGSYVFESWLVENEEDKANTVYDLGVPVGSWMVSMRVEDPATWKMIKNGELRGFSLEGSFLDKEDWDQYQKDREIYNKVIKILKSS